MNWIKKTEKRPEKYPVYATDYKEVWISIAWGILNEAWAEIPIPEVPEKELHCCNRKGFTCFETEEGDLLLEHPDTIIPAVCANCPFCGYSSKNQNKS